LVKLTEIVSDKAIVPALKAAERDAVILELVDALVGAGSAPAKIRQELAAKVLEREKRGSTGFGRGVAVPHVKHSGVSNMAAAIGLSQRGVDFNALDKQPVYSVVLLLSPEDKPEEHLQAMEVIFKNLSKDTFRRFLRQAGSVEDVRTLLEEADGQHLGGGAGGGGGAGTL
jgi:mannitol/fructose-specific phosphotransferase system IIA component (Ntr-type)